MLPLSFSFCLRCDVIWTSFNKELHSLTPCFVISSSLYRKYIAAWTNLRFEMAEKRKQSAPREYETRSSKFVNTVSFVSLAICITALVGVEIINQRVGVVEELVVEIIQTSKVDLPSNALSFKPAKMKLDHFGCNYKDEEPGKDARKGKCFMIFDRLPYFVCFLKVKNMF